MNGWRQRMQAWVGGRGGVVVGVSVGALLVWYLMPDLVWRSAATAGQLAIMGLLVGLIVWVYRRMLRPVLDGLSRPMLLPQARVLAFTHWTALALILTAVVGLLLSGQRLHEIWGASASADVIARSEAGDSGSPIASVGALPEPLAPASVHRSVAPVAPVAPDPTVSAAATSEATPVTAAGRPLRASDAATGYTYLPAGP